MTYLCGWLSVDPPILMHSAHQVDLGQYLPESRVTRLVTYMWHYSSQSILMGHHEAMAVRPSHVLHHLVNDPTTCRELVAQGISAHYVNSNAFLDERVFDIHPSAEKRFDAVYNARMARFKRHTLAAKVPRLCIIGGLIAEDDERDYFDEVVASMPNAEFVHLSEKRQRSPDEVATLLNESRVGLCLSACEGSMFSSTEYLLCGLPVVSTPSIGGRDIWFDPKFTRIVGEHPDAVIEGINQLTSRKISPQLIRNETLSRIWDHRRRFFELGQTIYSAERVGRDFARDFYANFTNKLGDWRSAEEILRRFAQHQLG